jgi:DNA-binding IclR family transcriptional regulator
MNTSISKDRSVPMGYVERGHLIRELLKLLRALDSKKAKTVKDISSESGMGLRQTYRWLEALEDEKMVEKFDKSPARYRLKPVGTRLRRSVKTE